jgi:hypothetical protein
MVKDELKNAGFTVVKPCLNVPAYKKPAGVS